jgi:hypothetical protein
MQDTRKPCETERRIHSRQGFERRDSGSAGIVIKGLVAATGAQQGEI